MQIKLQRIDDALNMEAVDESGHKVLMDAAADNGGKGNGLRPMQMLLMGLGGCSAIDIILILKKQKQLIEDFSITINAEREQDKEPALWAKAHMLFTFTGEVDKGKAQRATDLSMQKYCSVAETLRKSGTELTWEVVVKN